MRAVSMRPQQREQAAQPRIGELDVIDLRGGEMMGSPVGGDGEQDDQRAEEVGQGSARAINVVCCGPSICLGSASVTGLSYSAAMAPGSTMPWRSQKLRVPSLSVSPSCQARSATSRAMSSDTSRAQPSVVLKAMTRRG